MHKCKFFHTQFESYQQRVRKANRAHFKWQYTHKCLLYSIYTLFLLDCYQKVLRAVFIPCFD